MSFGFPPTGWALCNGQLLPINQNQALFSLLGTTYGGDGRVNFGLPNLQGNVPIHMGQGFTLGNKGGEQAHTISTAELPTHIHFAQAPAALGTVYNTTNASLVAMNPAAVANAGGSQAHQNMQPFLALSFCIALQGIFPSQN